MSIILILQIILRKRATRYLLPPFMSQHNLDPTTQQRLENRNYIVMSLIKLDEKFLTKIPLSKQDLNIKENSSCPHWGYHRNTCFYLPLRSNAQTHHNNRIKKKIVNLHNKWGGNLAAIRNRIELPCSVKKTQIIFLSLISDDISVQINLNVKDRDISFYKKISLLSRTIKYYP